jgi:hypothetical protein
MQILPGENGVLVRETTSSPGNCEGEVSRADGVDQDCHRKRG